VIDSRPGWGILATGGIAADFTRDLHLAGLRVAAVGSRTAERAEAFAREHEVPHAHASWEALAEDPSVDVIYVATPHSSHAAAARVALEHGKHVLVEKPFTLSEREAREVLELAASRGLVALEAMWTRWLPHMLEIHALIAAGRIGSPQLLIADHTQSVPTDPTHRMNAPELGGGALLDLGVYPVSFAHDLFGEPDAVLSAAVLTGTGATLVHAGGAHASITTALNLAGPNRAAILGTEGRVEIDDVWYTPTSYTVFDGTRARVGGSRPEVIGRGMQYQAFELERLLREGRTESERMTHEDTLAVMRTLDRLRAQSGVVYPQESAG
jgi:predicted dehydrogenase